MSITLNSRKVRAALLIPGAANHGFLINTLKTLFRLSKVLLDL